MLDEHQQEEIVVGLLEDDCIKDRVEQVWSEVFKNSNTVLKQAKDYGFLGIDIVPSPNIHEILLYLRVFDALMDILLDSAANFELDYDQVRRLLNAKGQLVNMGKVASALKAGNREDFESAIAALRNQAAF